MRVPDRSGNVATLTRTLTVSVATPTSTATPTATPTTIPAHALDGHDALPIAVDHAELDGEPAVERLPGERCHRHPALAVAGR